MMSGTAAARFAAAVLFALVAAPATSDVILDGTLHPGNDGMVPFDESPPVDPPSYLIDQSLGITSGNGRNLLHSFREFSLADGESARFTGDASIENVITRVTGGLESVIEGVIRSEIGTANFFFVNPSGITFRNVTEDNLENKIEVPGSFYASTGDQLLFSGGEIFTSSGLGGTPPDQILSVPAAWEFLGGLAGRIEVDQTLPLAVTNGSTLSLIGGDLRVHRGATIQADGGAIELAAVGSDAVQVPLALASWQPPDVSLGEIVVEGGATTGGSILRTNGAVGGRIVMRGGRLIHRENSLLLATGDASVGGAAIDLEFSESIVLDNGFVSPANAAAAGVGAVQIRTGMLSISNGGAIRQTTGNGDAGTVEIEADQILIETGGAIESRAAIGSGRGGDILVSARDLELSSASNIRTLTNSAGRAGDVIVNADEAVRVRDSSGIGSQSFAAGAAGDVTVAATLTIDLTGGSEISSASEAGSTGVGGDVLIAGSLDGNLAVEQFRLSEGAQIEAVTVTDQAGGNLRVVADQIEIEGSVNGGARPSGLFARSGRSAIDVGAGDAGSIRIESRTLEVAGASVISARSFGAGRSGRLEVVSTESVILRGTADGVPNLSIRVIDGDAGGVASGEPGLVVTTERLELHDGALVSASTLGRGEAGDVLIEAGSVLIRGEFNGIGSSIFAESGGRGTGAGSSGRIELIVRDDLELSEGGRLSVRTLGPGVSDRIDLQIGGDVRITGGAIVRSLAEGSGAAGDITFDVGGSLTVGGAGITAESLGSADAGEIRIVADGGIRVSGGRVTTAANAAGGGNIALESVRKIQLTESTILASVQGRTGEGDAGNVNLGANEITVNASRILAQATRGDGGRIQIVANRYLASAESLIDASSSAGIDGVVVVQAPDASLRGELARLPSVILDPGVLLRAPCAARATGLGSFVVLGASGSQQTPLEAGSLKMPLPGGAQDFETKPTSMSWPGVEGHWFAPEVMDLRGPISCARSVGENS